MSWISGMHNLGRVQAPSKRRDDQERVQCEHIATAIYNELPQIMLSAEYAGQVEQNVEASKGKLVTLIADIIQKELAR